ncbi:MAG: LptE family protein [Chitinophagaceae bacterium]|nr:LptE family protein [Chitinophagaceae bacterium]
MLTKRSTKIFLSAGFLALLALAFSSIQLTGCGVYKFNDINVPDSVKTIRIAPFENRATYVNPQLAQSLADRLRQKIVSQTRLRQTNNTNADWEISATITSYAFSTSGISQGREATNRLTVGVHIVRIATKSGDSKEYDVSRNFEFNASLSIQQAENQLRDEMIRGVTDDIFNRLFSDW